VEGEERDGERNPKTEEGGRPRTDVSDGHEPEKDHDRKGGHRCGKPAVAERIIRLWPEHPGMREV
jgi:hypothetical protein